MGGGGEGIHQIRTSVAHVVRMTPLSPAVKKNSVIEASRSTRTHAVPGLMPVPIVSSEFSGAMSPNPRISLKVIEPTNGKNEADNEPHSSVRTHQLSWLEKQGRVPSNDSMSLQDRVHKLEAKVASFDALANRVARMEAAQSAEAKSSFGLPMMLGGNSTAQLASNSPTRSTSIVEGDQKRKTPLQADV